MLPSESTKTRKARNFSRDFNESGYISQIRQVARDGHTADDRYVPGKARLLGIRTQRARPGSRSLHEGDLIRGGSEVHTRRIYRPWRGAVFNPIGEQCKEIEWVGCRSTHAVTHVRDRIKARELLSLFQAAEPLGHFFIVLDHVENRLARLASPVKPDDLVPIVNEESDISLGHVRGIPVELS
jgi:hypothetical protein